tara:strand:+ start:354 stop:2453 length:2100 start_codon:yes stop_codon:yes gene_type:complete
MPKIPTFEAEGTISQQTGTTTNVQIPLTQTLGTALKPVTDFVVKKQIQEKNFENRTEALKLENDFITDMQKVNDEVNVLENKEQANAIYKEKSNALISSYGEKASNQNVKTLFTNSALGEVQKGLFRVDTQISKNILNSLNNAVSQKENRLLTTAFLATGDFDYAVLQTDLEKLYKDHYTGQISNADLTKLINGIPGRIEIFEATQGLTENTRETFLKLKDDKQFQNMPLKERMELLNDARLILRPELRLDYKNFIAAAKVGKTIPFDMKFAEEVLDRKEIISMQDQFLMVTNALEDTRTLNRIPLKDIDETLKTMIKNKYDSMDFIDAQNMENYLKTIVSTRLEAMKTNPVKFIIDTNDEAKRLLDEFSTEENLTLKTENKKAFVNYIYEEQVKMGNPNYLIKVTSTDEANQFVEQYLQSDAGTRLAMLQNAEAQFGDFFSKAMLEFTEAGLPETAELSSFFGNPQLTKKFLSFDSDEEKKQLEEFVSLKDFPMKEIKRDILNDLEDFEAAVMFANKFDTSFAADKLDRIVDVLGYYAANEIRAGVKPSKAVKNASNLINQSFEIEDTYFIPRIYDGVSLPNGQVDFIKEKSKAIQEEYIDLWGAVSFKSFDENIDVELLDKEMKEQILKNGRWVNNSDGTGLIFGITFGDGSFAPVFNKEGETLELNFDDDSYLLPGTDIKIQIGGKEDSITDYKED